MKKAVIVVGSHWSGKSRTIIEFFKPLVGLSGLQRSFSIGESKGSVLSQSLEEKNGQIISQSAEEKGLDNVKDFVNKYAHFDKLVFAARPSNETPSLYLALKDELKKHGFNVHTEEVVKGQADSVTIDIANRMYAHLQC